MDLYPKVNLGGDRADKPRPIAQPDQSASPTGCHIANSAGY
ncbi:hypothetical protein [Kovacikia minuta]|nr:hypothetical protein [Kovacikia minuta]